MIKSIICPALSVALEKLKGIVAANERDGKNTVIFCEDRLTLAAERTVCAAVGGTFSTSVFTFARFLSSERGKKSGVLSSQGSAMVVRRIIDENKDRLKLFGKFSAAASAAAVYDTIALLYASKISADDVVRAAATGLLESKLHDIAIVYEEYEKYLKENGKTDRNAYLAELPEVITQSDKIAGSEVIFLGFRSFTRSSLDCVKAVFGYAKNVQGLFIGGREEIYVNEGAASFEGAAERFGGAVYEFAPSTLIPEAELLRRNLFDPESLCKKVLTKCSNISIVEADDEENELEYIAAKIKKHVIDGGERYAKISVMLPDVAAAERDIARVFSQYRIPYYADRRRKLSEHPVCAFINDYINCVLSGCAFKDSDGVIASPFFPESREDKDIYRNYALRLANFRGGVKREPKPEILAEKKFNYEAVQRVRSTFLKGLGFIPNRGGASAVCDGIRKLLTEFKVEDKLKALAEKFKDSYPTAGQFSGRVYEGVLTVLSEAEDVAGGGNMPLKEFAGILKSGFGAMEISLIPPKADAVFVGDIAVTANTGSSVVFAARLTDAVPASSADTALLTDREITALENANLDISPKIRQVNMRNREQIALNICAFKNCLYLTYPVRCGGEESGASEIIEYASATFAAADGTALKAVSTKRLNPLNELPYYCSERLPALKRLNSDLSPQARAAVYGVLKDGGYEKQAGAAVSEPAERKVKDGRNLFVTFNSISPTALETYFTCPYRNFMQQGLKLQEREEGVMRPIDTGNFIHSVLQTLGPELGGIKDEVLLKGRAREIAEEMLAKPAYSSLTDSKSGEYTAKELVAEAVAVSEGMYEQLKNSRFNVESTELKCEIKLDGGIKINGRIDRVDGCEDMVRIIDYKTGTVEASATKYYMGLKLQLPLYLTAASAGRRAVGAYYFPATVEYKSKADGVFRLQGFMDGSDEVVSNSDTKVEAKKKSAYFDAYLSGKKLDSAMDSQTFSDFLQYSALVARKGTQEMLGGNITPSPAADACTYCKMGGSCGFAVGVDGEERTHRTVKCAEIAAIVQKNRGD